MLNAASHLQRSVKRGWTYNDVGVDQVPASAISLAMSSMEAARLDLGAVSVVVDGKIARVTNIQTGPALSNDQLELYVAAIQDFAGKDAKDKASKKAKILCEDPSGIDRTASGRFTGRVQYHVLEEKGQLSASGS